MNFTDVFYIYIDNIRVAQAIQIQAKWLGYTWLNRNTPQKLYSGNVILFNYEKMFSMRYIPYEKLPSVQGSMGLDEFFKLKQEIHTKVNSYHAIIDPKLVYINHTHIPHSKIKELYEKVFISSNK